MAWVLTKMKKTNYRRAGLFAKRTVAVVAIFFASQRAFSAEVSPMEYVSVCDANNNCRKFSRLIMGTDHLIQGGWTNQAQAQITKEQAFAVLDEAAKHGINLFDTSPIYVNGVESILDQWLESRRPEIAKSGYYTDPGINPDRKLYTVTKGGVPYDLFYSKALPAGEHSEELKSVLTQRSFLGASSPDGSAVLKNVPAGTYASRLYGNKGLIVKRVMEEMGHSIGNLDEQFTIYLMHRDDGDFVDFARVKRDQTPVRTIMEALATPELSRNYTYLGWSNWTTDRINESLRLSVNDPALPKPRFNSAYFSLFEMSSRTIHAGGVQVRHAEMMDPAFQRGILQNPYSPLGGFSVLDKEAPTWENAKKAAQLKYDQGDAYWKNVFHAIFTDENQARYNRAAAFAEDFNRARGTRYTVDQMVNAYALAHKRTDFLTVGPITVEQVRRTVASLELSRMLTEDDLNYMHSGVRSSRNKCTKTGVLRSLAKP